MSNERVPASRNTNTVLFLLAELLAAQHATDPDLRK